MTALNKIAPAKVQASIVMYYLFRKDKPDAITEIKPGRYKITIHRDGLSVFAMMLPVPGAFDIDYEPFCDAFSHLVLPPKVGESQKEESVPENVGIRVDASILGTGITANWTFGTDILAEMQKAYNDAK